LIFKFREDELVALRRDLPQHGLRAGDLGTVWALYATEPPSYEVTFRLPDGSNLGMIMDEDELESPASPN
jgi:hypothetical protein